VNTMKKSTTLFTQDEINTIETTIKDAEEKTSAEIVPVIASCSGRYDRAEDLFAFILALLSLTFVWLLFQGSIENNTWNVTSELNLNLMLIVIILIVSFFIGIALASYFPLLRLPLISKNEMQEEVENSARETFQRLKIRRTKNANGVLIYVSLYEHMVHVVGDDSINAKLAQSDWNELCNIITQGFKNGKPEEGMRNGILQCGKLLSEHFENNLEDENELPNQLHLID